MQDDRCVGPHGACLIYAEQRRAGHVLSVILFHYTSPQTQTSAIVSNDFSQMSHLYKIKTDPTDVSEKE